MPRRDDDARVRVVWCPTRAALARAVERERAARARDDAPTRALVVASSAPAAIAATRAMATLARTVDCATATKSDARRVASDVDAAANVRARRLRATRATIARARRADACAVDAEDGDEGAEATVRLAAAMRIADGERVVFVRSPLACAIARARGMDVDEDGTTRGWETMRAMATREETRRAEDEPSAEALVRRRVAERFRRARGGV